MGLCSGKENTQTAEEIEAAAPLQLSVAVVGVRGIRSAEWQSTEDKPDCFCIVKSMKEDQELCRTQALKGAYEPAWKQEFEIAELETRDSLHFCVMEDDKVMGIANLEPSIFASAGFNGELKLEQTDEGIEAYLKVKARVKGREYPEGAPAEFSITVTRLADKPLGLDIDSQDGVACLVNGIRPGPFQVYNENSKAEEHLRLGDFIVRANNVDGNSAKLLKEMTSATTLTVLIRRSEEFRVVIERSDTRKPLGLQFSRKLMGRSLLVTKVPKGPIQAWNKANAEREVRQGDRVVAVCGKQGTAAELQKQLGVLKKVDMTVLRPASLTSWQFW